MKRTLWVTILSEQSDDSNTEYSLWELQEANKEQFLLNLPVENAENICAKNNTQKLTELNVLKGLPAEPEWRH